MSGDILSPLLPFIRVLNFCLAQCLRGQAGIISVKIFIEVVEQAMKCKFLFSAVPAHARRGNAYKIFLAVLGQAVRLEFL